MSIVRRLRAGRYSGAIAAMLYLICIVATPAALAMTNGTMAAHCLAHQDADHAEHTVSNASSGKDLSIGPQAEGEHFSSAAVTKVSASFHSDSAEHDDAVVCCGLFSVVAFNQTSASPTFSRSFVTTERGWAERRLEGRATERLFEPPIASLLV